MLKEIEKNLMILKAKIHKQTNETIENVFGTFFKSLINKKLSDIELAQFYNSSYLNETLNRECQYFQLFISQDLQNLLNEIRISPNQGYIQEFEDQKKFKEILQEMSLQNYLQDVSIICHKQSQKVNLNSKLFQNFQEIICQQKDIQKLNLDFKNAQIDTKDIVYLMEGMNEKYSNISSLGIDFSDNPELDDQIGIQILLFLEKQKSLTSLILSFHNTNIGGSTIRLLADILLKNSHSLHFLRLSLTNLKNIKWQEILEISRALSAQKRLLQLELFLGGNEWINPENLNQLLISMRNLKTLLHLELDFSYSSINIQNFERSFRHFKNLHNLKVFKLYLNGSEIPQDDFYKCEEMILSLRNLEVFGLEIIQDQFTQNNLKSLENFEQRIQKKISLFYLVYQLII